MLRRMWLCLRTGGGDLNQAQPICHVDVCCGAFDASFCAGCVPENLPRSLFAASCVFSRYLFLPLSPLTCPLCVSSCDGAAFVVSLAVERGWGCERELNHRPTQTHSQRWNRNLTQLNWSHWYRSRPIPALWNELETCVCGIISNTCSFTKQY